MDVCLDCKEPVNEGPTRIVSNGRAFHKDHFKCATCKESLVGKPHYFGTETEVFCQADYRARFVDKCHACAQHITLQYMVYEGNKYHVECFKCSTCDQPMGESLFIMNGKPTCNDCYSKHMEKCAKCNGVLDGEYLTIRDKLLHKHCFTCSSCNGQLPTNFYEIDGQPICDNCHTTQHRVPCAACGKTVTDSAFADIGGKKFHHACLVCVSCSKQLLGPTVANAGVYPSGDKFECEDCYLGRRAKATTTSTTTVTLTETLS